VLFRTDAPQGVPLAVGDTQTDADALAIARAVGGSVKALFSAKREHPK